MIPKAFTRPATKGEPFTQGGHGEAPIRRWDSWYDPTIVTAEGEAILEELDDWAIKTLRSNKLVWSGWGPSTVLNSRDHERIANSNYGFRRVKPINTTTLRRFFLSLLWRAAVSKMSEFRYVNLPSNIINRISRIIKMEEQDDILLYPIVLVQMSDFGEIHNQSPSYLTDWIHPLSGEAMPHVIRFYFDGLIVRFLDIVGNPPDYVLGGITIGHKEDEISVITMRWEQSFQREMLNDIFEESLQYAGIRTIRPPGDGRP